MIAFFVLPLSSFFFLFDGLSRRCELDQGGRVSFIPFVPVETPPARHVNESAPSTKPAEKEMVTRANLFLPSVCTLNSRARCTYRARARVCTAIFLPFQTFRSRV